MATIPIGGKHNVYWGQYFEDFLSNTVSIFYSIGDPETEDWVEIDNSVVNTVGSLNTYEWTNEFEEETNDVYIIVRDNVATDVYATIGPYKIGTLIKVSNKHFCFKLSRFTI